MTLTFLRAKSASRWLGIVEASPSGSPSPGPTRAQAVGEVALVEDQLVEIGLEMPRRDLGHARLVEGLLGVADREDRHAVTLLLGEIREDGGGVDATGEEEPERHVRAAAAADRLAHEVVELVGEIVGASAGQIGLDEVIGEVRVPADVDLAVLGNQEVAGGQLTHTLEELNGAGK